MGPGCGSGQGSVPCTTLQKLLDGVVEAETIYNREVLRELCEEIRGIGREAAQRSENVVREGREGGVEDGRCFFGAHVGGECDAALGVDLVSAPVGCVAQAVDMFAVNVPHVEET